MLTIQTIEELEENYKRAGFGTVDYEYTGNSYFTLSREPSGEIIAKELEDYEAEPICDLLNNAPDLLAAAKWALLNGFKQE